MIAGLALTQLRPNTVGNWKSGLLETCSNGSVNITRRGILVPSANRAPSVSPWGHDCNQQGFPKIQDTCHSTFFARNESILKNSSLERLPFNGRLPGQMKGTLDE